MKCKCVNITQQSFAQFFMEGEFRQQQVSTALLTLQQNVNKHMDRNPLASSMMQEEMDKACENAFLIAEENISLEIFQTKLSSHIKNAFERIKELPECDEQELRDTIMAYDVAMDEEGKREYITFFQSAILKHETLISNNFEKSLIEVLLGDKKLSLKKDLKITYSFLDNEYILETGGKVMTVERGIYNEVIEEFISE